VKCKCCRVTHKLYETLVRNLGLEVNAQEVRYILMLYQQSVGLSHNMKAANKLFEIMVQFK